MRIFLVGLPAVGKSSVGKRIADRLGLAFYDSDAYIEQQAGVSIPWLFELEGEAKFRQRESLAIDHLSKLPNSVLATGGGAVLLPLNRQLLRERGIVIYLTSSIDDQLQRLEKDKSRPLLQVADKRQKLLELYQLRHPLYLGLAHHVLDTENMSVGQVTQRVLKLFKERHESP